MSDTVETWICHDCKEGFEFSTDRDGRNELATMQYRHDNALYQDGA